MWICPTCGSDNLSVTVTVRARLIQHPDNFETDIDGGDHEWDRDSLMCCNACNHADKASAFSSEDAHPIAREMKELGMAIQDTGGGCLAYVCDDGLASAWVTDADGSRLPCSKSEPMIFGVYLLIEGAQEPIYHVTGNWDAIAPHAYGFSMGFSGQNLTLADMARPEVAFSVALEAYKSAAAHWATCTGLCEYCIESTDIFESLSQHGLPCTDEAEALVESALDDYSFNVLAASVYKESCRNKEGA